MSPLDPSLLHAVVGACGPTSARLAGRRFLLGIQGADSGWLGVDTLRDGQERGAGRLGGEEVSLRQARGSVGGAGEHGVGDTAGRSWGPLQRLVITNRVLVSALQRHRAHRKDVCAPGERGELF